MEPIDLYIRAVRLKQPEDGEADSYVFGLPVVRHLGTLEFDRRVTFFVGENGSGKSTLLEAVAAACGFNPEGGSRNFNFSSRDTHSPLHRSLAVTRGPIRPRDGFFLRAESFYNVASKIDDLKDGPDPDRFLMQYGGKSLHEQSHGESFLALVLNRFRGQGLYLLDEPEAALSPARQMALLARVDQLAREGSQFLIASHSPILTACPDAAIYQLTEDGMERVAYERTENYQVTKAFLNNPQRMLRYLLER